MAMHACVEGAYGVQKWPHKSSILVFEGGSLTWIWAHQLSRWALRSACFLPQNWDYTPGHHGVPQRCWESNVGPHVCTASFLPTPQVLALDLNSLIQNSILNLIAGNTPLVEKEAKKKRFWKVCIHDMAGKKHNINATVAISTTGGEA